MAPPDRGSPAHVSPPTQPRGRAASSAVQRHIVLTVGVALVGLGLVVLASISDVSTLARLVGVGLAVVVSVVLGFFVTRDSLVQRGLGALVAGVIGVSVGGALGPVWLVTSGLSLVGVVMTSCLVAGLLLLGSGAWLLVRATPGWRRLAAIPVAFLLLQFVVIPVAGAVYGTHPPSTPLSAARPSDAREVRFETADGVTLAAWYTPSRNGATVIVLPGSGGDKGSTVEHARALVDHGYGVLTLDSRGSGGSGGVGNAWGWHGVADVAGAVAWLRGQDAVDPERIGALGLSMGGEVAITAAASTDGLAAIVAEGVSARVPADLAFLPADVTGTIQRVDGEIMWALARLMTDVVPPMPLAEAVARGTDVPSLVIVGRGEDEVAAARLLIAARPSLELWELPQTPHIQSLELHPEEWRARVICFFDSTL